MQNWQVSARIGLAVGWIGSGLQAMIKDLPLAIAAVASVLVAQPVTAEETSPQLPITAIPQISELK